MAPASKLLPSIVRSNVLGDTKLQAEGKLDKAEGRAQNTAGGIKDTLRDR